MLCRLAFEYKYWDTDPNILPLTLVLEEAHNYLPRSDDARDRVCLDRVERIAKEGRKYGVSLFVVSQRPSEVSETVLSQCGNFVVLRLTNPTDQGYVKRLLPDFLAVADGSDLLAKIKEQQLDQKQSHAFAQFRRKLIEELNALLVEPGSGGAIRAFEIKGDERPDLYVDREGDDAPIALQNWAPESRS